MSLGMTSQALLTFHCHSLSAWRNCTTMPIYQAKLCGRCSFSTVASFSKPMALRFTNEALDYQWLCIPYLSGTALRLSLHCVHRLIRAFKWRLEADLLSCSFSAVECSCVYSACLLNHVKPSFIVILLQDLEVHRNYYVSNSRWYPSYSCIIMLC